MLAPSAPTPQTPQDGPAVVPNPPRSPLFPKRPPAQKPQVLQRSKRSDRETGTEPLLLPSPWGGPSSAVLGVPASVWTSIQRAHLEMTHYDVFQEKGGEGQSE